MIWLHCSVIEGKADNNGDMSIPGPPGPPGHHGQIVLGSKNNRPIRCLGNRGVCGPRWRIKSHKADRRRRERCKHKANKCRRTKIRRCRKKRRCKAHVTKKCRKMKRKCLNNRPGGRSPKHTSRGPNYGKTSITTVVPVTRPKKHEKEICNRTSECDVGLCCARHHHVKRCKPLLRVGQICTRPHITKRSPEAFERCPCEAGLACAASNKRHHTCQLTSLIT
uniref:Dickkopf-related protein 1/2/4 C-terminal subdomain 1 domain-containing protein n=1 Tax=Ciona savignyi TaxID=51511 RepID=H2YCJ8_CIOSA